jgi:hypothetical protein
MTHSGALRYQWRSARGVSAAYAPNTSKAKEREEERKKRNESESVRLAILANLFRKSGPGSEPISSRLRRPQRQTRGSGGEGRG